MKIRIRQQGAYKYKNRKEFNSEFQIILLLGNKVRKTSIYIQFKFAFDIKQELLGLVKS